MKNIKSDKRLLNFINNRLIKSKESLQDKNFIIIPKMTGKNHFSVCIVCYPLNVIYAYSKPHESCMFTLNSIKNHSESLDNRKIREFMNVLFNEESAFDDSTLPSLSSITGPQQKGGSACGYYIIYHLIKFQQSQGLRDTNSKALNYINKQTIDNDIINFVVNELKSHKNTTLTSHSQSYVL